MNFKLLSVFVVLANLALSVSANAQLYCAHNGSNWQPRNTQSNSWIGKFGYGFSATSSCESAVGAAGYGSVCNWNGSNYQPYSIQTGGPIGKTDYGFSSFEGCKRTTSADRFGVMCQWNGNNYQPHNSQQGTPIGKPDYGFTTFEACIRTAEVAFTGVTCNWNGSGYQPYMVQSNQFVGKLDHGHSSLDNCLQSSSSAQRGVCNWDGYAWSAYSLYQPSQVMRSFADLGACHQFTAYNNPTGQVSLTVNGKTQLNSYVGQTLTYRWASSGVQSVRSYYTADHGDTCPGGITDEDIANGVTKPWVVSVPNESKTLQADVQACQAGVTYTIFLEATMFDGSSRNTSIRIRVN